MTLYISPWFIKMIVVIYSTLPSLSLQSHIGGEYIILTTTPTLRQLIKNDGIHFSIMVKGPFSSSICCCYIGT